MWFPITKSYIFIIILKLELIWTFPLVKIIICTHSPLPLHHQTQIISFTHPIKHVHPQHCNKFTSKHDLPFHIGSTELSLTGGGRGGGEGKIKKVNVSFTCTNHLENNFLSFLKMQKRFLIPNLSTIVITSSMHMNHSLVSKTSYTIMTKIDLFPYLIFSQKVIKYAFIIRNIFYGIVNSTHTGTAYMWVTHT